MIDRVKIMMDLITTGDIDEMIAFAKEYNIFQESNSKFYDMMCEAIRTRLDSENLPYDTVRP